MMPPDHMLKPGLRVGLLGGSFNPAHEGHLHVTRMCLAALGLDCVWWLVSPQNPLKSETDMAPFETRLAAARAFIEREAPGEPVAATGIETELGTRYTIDTVRALRRRFPGLHFVWLMGADNMLQLPRWARWEELVREVPIAVYPRPGYTAGARTSPAARALREATLETRDAHLLAGCEPPALVFLEGPEHAASATAIRAGTEPPAGPASGPASGNVTQD